MHSLPGMVLCTALHSARWQHDKSHVLKKLYQDPTGSPQQRQLQVTSKAGIDSGSNWLTYLLLSSIIATMTRTAGAAHILSAEQQQFNSHHCLWCCCTSLDRIDAPDCIQSPRATSTKPLLLQK